MLGTSFLGSGEAGGHQENGLPQSRLPARPGEPPWRVLSVASAWKCRRNAGDPHLLLPPVDCGRRLQNAGAMQEIGSAVRAAASFDRPVGGGPAAIGRAHHFAHFVHDEPIPRGKVQMIISHMELNSRS
jgi:hypothetical protein